MSGLSNPQASPTPTSLRERIEVIQKSPSVYSLGWQIAEDKTDQILSLVTTYIEAAEIRGMQKAKSRILRRTEIPKDARNPTRDATVLLGEAIADIVQGDIDALQAQKAVLESKK